jgi:hypothetical protein
LYSDESRGILPQLMGLTSPRAGKRRFFDALPAELGGAMRNLVIRPAGGATGLALTALIALAPVGAQAAVLTQSYAVASCNNGALSECTDTVSLNTTLAGAASNFIGDPTVGGSLATFTTAFDAWNAAQVAAGGASWTLVNGGELNLTIHAAIGAALGNFVGGLSPVLFTISGESQLLIPDLVWTQALVVNYSPLQGALSTPMQTLDTFSLSQDGTNLNFPTSCSTWSNGAGAQGATFCGPIYPFQYGTSLSNYGLVTPSGTIPLGDDFFYDAPAGEWPNASFDAIALLSTVNTSNDTLTVYQGVAYGFSLSAVSTSVEPVPEPSTWAMLLSGFAGVGLVGYAARKKALAA